MVLRTMLFVERCKGGRLRHQDQAQQQQYIHVSPLCAPTNCHLEYSITLNGGALSPRFALYYDAPAAGPVTGLTPAL
jgi:hypothetical protein